MAETPESIEREVEDKRASVERTLDALKERMNMGQIADEVGHYLHMDDARKLLGSIGEQARANPVALGLIGVGVAWLVMGGSSSSSRDMRHRRVRPGGFDDRTTRQGGGAGPGYPLSTRDEAWSDDGGDRAGLRDQASHLADRVGDTVRETAAAARDRMQAGLDEGRDMLAEGRHEFDRQTRGLRGRGRRAGEEAVHQIEEHPLLIGAVVAVIGAVIGASLPSTRTEDRWLGAERDHLLDEGRAAASAMGDRARRAAHRTYEAARDAAEEEGLLTERDGGDGRTLAERAERVGEAAVDEARSEAGALLRGEPEPGTTSERDARAATSTRRSGEG